MDVWLDGWTSRPRGKEKNSQNTLQVDFSTTFSQLLLPMFVSYLQFCLDVPEISTTVKGLQQQNEMEGECCWRLPQIPYWPGTPRCQLLQVLADNN